MALTITIEKGDVLIKTGLSYLAIITYTERIMRLKGWADTMTNRVEAKRVLDAMIVIEHQNKLFLPIDWDDIWSVLNYSINHN